MVASVQMKFSMRFALTPVWIETFRNLPNRILRGDGLGMDALAFSAGRRGLTAGNGCKAIPPTSHEITFASLDACGSASHPARDAPMSTGFGVPEHQGEGSLLPMLVRSGNLSL